MFLHRIGCRLLGAVLFLMLAANRSDAQYNWIYSELSGHRYSFTLEPRTWAHAEAIAVSLGGHLAASRSPLENAWLSNAFPGRPFWIGLSDQRAEGQFEWSSGEPIPWSNWCAGEPSQAPNDDCVLLDPACGARWDAVDQNALYYGVIELPTDASFRVFGTSCGGDIRCLYCPPRTGDTFAVFFENLPPNAPFVVILGISNAYSGSSSLPIDLAPIGMNGCQLYVSTEMSFLDQASTSGNRTWPPPNGSLPFFFVIPLQPQLIGVELFMQGLIRNPAANSLGFTTTAAGHIVIGGP
jgi:hypothetical protein